MSHKPHKYIYYSTSTQNYHPINIKETKENQSQNHSNTDTSKKRKELTDHHKNMRNTDQNSTNKQKDVINVVTHPTWKVVDVLPVDIDASTTLR